MGINSNIVLNHSLYRLKIEKLQTRTMFQVARLLGNKTMVVCAYILSCINETHNFYYLNKVQLAKRLHCSRSLIYKAVKVLKQDSYINIHGHYVSLNLSKIPKEVDEK